MPPRASNTSSHIHKKQRPVSTISSKEVSLLPASHHDDSLPKKVKSSITWGQRKASLPYHEEEYSHAVTIPHPRYHPTPEKGYEHIPDTLHGVPVLGDQVEFNHDSQDVITEPLRRRSSSKGVFGKMLGKRENPQSATATGTSYPAKLVGMTLTEKQNLASQAREHEPSPSESVDYEHERHRHHHHRPRKSVSWDPELGSITTSSSSDIPEPVQHTNSPSAPLISMTGSASSGDSVASDKTMWPFTRRPTSLSGSRSRNAVGGKQSSSGSVEDNGTVMDIERERQPAFNGFEFTPRQYVPLWTPSAEVGQSPPEQHHTPPPPTFALPTTPPAQQSRHRRSFSICKPHWRSPTSQTTGNFPPAFMDAQLSPSLAHASSGTSAPAWPPALLPFGSTKVYTPPSPYDHSIASFSTHQGLQKDLGMPTGQWSRVDFGNGSADGSAGGSAPSRTLMYAAEDWLRTQ